MAALNAGFHHPALVDILHTARGFLFQHLGQHFLSTRLGREIDRTRHLAALMWVEAEGQTRLGLGAAIENVLHREVAAEAGDMGIMALGLARWGIGHQ